MSVRWFVIALWFFGLAPAGSAQERTTKATTPPGQIPAPSHVGALGSIMGTVYCDDTHKPARGADVYIFKEPTPGKHDSIQRRTATDSEGHFSFSRLIPGNYALDAHLTGYIVDASAPITPPRTDGKPPAFIFPKQVGVTLLSSETLTRDIDLVRGAVLAGQVLFPDGTPAIGLAIHLENAAPSNDPTQQQGDVPQSIVALLAAADKYTNDQGRFRIVGLPTGTYRVSVMPKLQKSYLDFQMEGDSDEYIRFKSIFIYSGNVFHAAEAKTYDLKPGDVVDDIRIDVPLDKLHNVRGTLLSMDGRTPNMGIAQLVDTSDASIRFMTDVEIDGSFSFAGVPSGRYKLNISQASVGKPNTRYESYSDEDADIPVATFADVSASVIVADDDVPDLHFELKEIPMPVKKPKASATGTPASPSPMP